MKKHDAMGESFEEATISGKPALFTGTRLDRGTIPNGCHSYEARHDDNRRGDAGRIAKGIWISHWGALITRDEIKPPPDGLLDIEPEDLNYGTGDCRNMADHMKKYPPKAKQARSHER